MIVWKTNQTLVSSGIDSAVPALIANLLYFLLAHYMLRQPGGWVIAKDNFDLKEIKRQNKKENITKFFRFMPNLGIINYCQKQLPKNDLIYSYFAFGTLLTVIVTFSLDKNIYQANTILVNFLQSTALFISTIFICRNLLIPNSIKEKYMGLIWLISIFVGLAFISSFLVLISKFSQISLVIFILSLSIIGMLLTWQLTLLMIISGASLAFYCYKYYIGFPISSEIYDLKLKIVYTLFMITAFMIAFLKPQQEQQELEEKRKEHLDNQIKDFEAEIIEMLSLKEEFIRNIEHETKTPLTGTFSLAESLLEYYDKLPKEKLIEILKEIGRNSHRLESWANNLCDLAKLNSLKAALNLQQLNFSNLIYERVEFCRKLYETEKHDLEFIYEIKPDIIINADDYFIKQVIDNLIINALQYNKKGNITIKLSKEEDQMMLSIQDEGIGIPPAEIYDVFDPFTVSSRTKTPAGGRGIGLALCKKVVDVHKGEIWVENNKIKGVTFNITLPTKLEAPNLTQSEITISTSTVAKHFLKTIEEKIKKDILVKLEGEGFDVESLKIAIELHKEKGVEINHLPLEHKAPTKA